MALGANSRPTNQIQPPPLSNPLADEIELDPEFMENLDQTGL
jgi:hypothetical protein